MGGNSSLVFNGSTTRVYYQWEYARTMRFRRKVFAIPTLVMAIAGLLAQAPSASAHAVFVASIPAKNSTVAAMPHTVSIRFDDKIIDIVGKHANVLSVSDAKGHLVSTGYARVAGDLVTTDIKPGAARGRVTISWRVISDDGHPVTGISFFTVKK